MKTVQPQVFDITKHRPAVLLVGNGLNRCAGDKTSWDAAIQRLAKDDAILDKIDEINYSIRATVTADADEQKRWARYDKLFGDNFKLPENPLLQKLLQIPFDAVLTTNYTYELENALDTSYPHSPDKEEHAFTTIPEPVRGQQPDAIRLLNTFNQFKNGEQEVNIWHIHGEVREPASMILTHEEYGRLVAELVKREQPQDFTQVRFESWMDYFIYGDLYVLGQGINFAEFDLWWLLSRRQREKSGYGKAIFYAPRQHDKLYTEVEEALDQIGMRIINLKKVIPDRKKATDAEFDDFFYKFYETATYDLKNKIEQPIPLENEKLIDYRNRCMNIQTRSNKLRLLYQLSKTEIYVLGENVKSKMQGTEIFLPIMADKTYGINHVMFLFSHENAYPGVLLKGQELRKMTGLEALDLAEKNQKIEALFLDLRTTREGVWISMKQAEYMRHDPEELKEYEKSANDKDLARRKNNANKASEPAHHIGAFISNNSFPDTLEEAQADIKYLEYFNFEAVLREPEVQWILPKSAKIGDIVFFAYTKSSKEKIIKLQEEQKKAGKYPKLAKELSRALKNFDKYGGKIYAIGQVCELPEEIKPDDPFYVNPAKNHWRSKHYCSVTNLIELDHPVDYKLQQGSCTPVSAEAFSQLRNLILENNNEMKFPLYFLKSTVSQSDAHLEPTGPGPMVPVSDPEGSGSGETKKPAAPVSEPKSSVFSEETGNAEESSFSRLLRESKAEIIDKRTNGGALWIIGGQELKGLIEQCKNLGVKFIYKPGGGKVSKNRDAWWTTDPDPAP